MKHSNNLVHKIKEVAEKSGKTGKYILAMLPFLVQTLNANAREAAPLNKENPKTMITNTITQIPDKNPDRFMDNDPVSVKDITLKQEYITSTKEFFAIMSEFLLGAIDDIDLLNKHRKAVNKNVKMVHDITQNGKATARFAVTSFFAKEDGQLVIKNISEINGETISYETEATIKSIMYKNSPALLFETDDRAYDYNLVLTEDSEVSVVQKGNRNKALKLNIESDLLKFEELLKETFPPAYISYRDQAWQELKEKENSKNK